MRDLSKLPKAMVESIAWHQEELRKVVTMAVLSTYEIDKKDALGEGKFIIPSMELYSEIANQLAIPVFKRGYQSYMKALLTDLGAIYYKSDGYRFFRGVRRLDSCVQKAEEESKRHRAFAHGWKINREERALGYGGRPVRQSADAGTWEKILEKEGLPRELGFVANLTNIKHEVNVARIEKATQAMWRCLRDYYILKLYVEGKAIIPIASLLQIGRRVVWNRLKFYGLSDSEEEIKK